jgi:hypothetical protein
MAVIKDLGILTCLALRGQDVLIRVWSEVLLNSANYQHSPNSSVNTVQNIYKRMVQFQTLTRNLFLTLQW